AVFNFGSNDSPTSGDMADWENIDPGSDGSFAVVCSQYQGTLPGWPTDGSKGYGITAVRLEELNTTPVAAAITNQPQSTNVYELAPASFSVGAMGNPAPTYQWYKNNSVLTNETNPSYYIPSAPLSDNGAVL